MVHGSSVAKGYKGMRSGISLVEMLIAIVLFGVLAAMSFKYIKIFYNTDVATKQARIGALIEQGTQLTNAYDIYTMKYGAAPASLAILSNAAVKVLTQTPTTIDEIGTAGTGWQYTQVANLTSGGLGAVAGGTSTAYYFDLASTDDDAEYCAVVNNMADGTTSLVATSTTTFASTTYYETGAYSDFYCVGTGALGAAPYRIFFVK